MGLISADTLIQNTRLFRCVWLSGRPGGGKTSLAMMLAHHLLASGEYRYLLSNVKTVWNDDPSKVVFSERKQLDAVVVIDEGGLFLKTGRDVEDFMAYMRKLNVVLIIPSVKPPAQDMRELIVQRTMNMYALGLPVWAYEGRLTSGTLKQKYRFFWHNPTVVYGLYDTDGMPDEDSALNVEGENCGSLSEWFRVWIDQKKALEGYAARKRRDELQANVSGLDGAGRQLEAFAESASALTAALSLSSFEGQRRGRKR